MKGPRIMTAAELIAYLKEFPLDLDVYLSRDPEGNGIHNVEEITVQTDYEDHKAIVLWPGYTELEL